MLHLIRVRRFYPATCLTIIIRLKPVKTGNYMKFSQTEGHFVAKSNQSASQSGKWECKSVTMIDHSLIFTICQVESMDNEWKQEIRWLFWTYQKFKIPINWVLTLRENPSATVITSCFLAAIFESANAIFWISQEKCL